MVLIVKRIKITQKWSTISTIGIQLKYIITKWNVGVNQEFKQFHKLHITYIRTIPYSFTKVCFSMGYYQLLSGFLLNIFPTAIG